MSPTPRWITISAASALGLGIMATGAVGVANAMPLVDSTTTAAVPPISTVPGHGFGDVKGSGGMGLPSVPAPSSSPDGAGSDPSNPTTTTPGTSTGGTTAPGSTSPGTSSPGVQAPPVPQPPATAQPVSPNTVSPISPVTVDSVD